MKKITLTFLLILLIVSACLSQTVVDGFQYILGDKGIDSITNTEYQVAEQINPATYTVVGYADIEINEMYPYFISSTPNRGSVTISDRHNDSDDGDWSPGGIHPGEDWNYGSVGEDIGMPIYATANGVIHDFRMLSYPINKSGWCMVIKHFMPDGSYVYSFYMHITNIANTDGAICLNESDFGFSIGEEVTRGQMIARIGNVTSFGSHCHFEIRSLYDQELDLWPNGPGGRYPEYSNSYKYAIDIENVALAYYEMQLDGILDASDFIDTHRPSEFIETEPVCIDPEIEWQNTIGGISNDELYVVKKVSNGYILGGNSNSDISIDKIEISNGGIDYWIIKTDDTGMIQWQNTIGGSGDDRLCYISQTTDNGYILGGCSNSGISGDKNESSYGAQDLWIVKIDSIGNIQWQNTIGGSGDDILSSIKQTVDGGYILGSYSNSNISGDKAEASLGGIDYWILKLDFSGNVQWQNTIGGSDGDYLYDIIQTSDNQYLLGGYSNSSISVDKTEATNGNNDYWIIKIDDFGDIQWQNTIGGSGDDILFSIQEIPSSGYLIGGKSGSNISGDKSENSLGYLDYWILKLDFSGNVQWQNTIGGNLDDNLTSISKTGDNGVLISGYSNSGISGDKNEALIGIYDGWIVKIDSIGNIQWQNTIGGTGYDFLYCTQEISSGEYILGFTSGSTISGDKDEDNLGNYDYWVIKLFGTCNPSTEICNTFDDDCDGLIDEDLEPSISIEALGSTTFCQGSSVVLTATHTGTSVQWYKNGSIISGATYDFITVSATGNYTCISSNECASTTSNSVIVNVNKNPSANITAGGPTSFCFGGSVTLTANTGASLSYQWYKGATAIAGATSINYVATTSGNYKCRVTKTATGCYKNSNTITVSVTCREGVSIDQILSPNPASNILYVDLMDFESDALDIYMINNIGQKVLAKKTEGGHLIDLDISSLPKGLYSFFIMKEGFIIYSEKFIVE